MSGLTPARGRKVFEEALAESGYGKPTIRQKLVYLRELFSYLDGLGRTDLRNVTRQDMVGYARHLTERLNTSTGEPIAPRTRLMFWSVARIFFRILRERGLILVHPMHGLSLAKEVLDFPRVTMSEAEVARFLDGIDTTNALGLRDRALFELIYSSGLRAGEAASLLVGDVDLSGRLLRVRMAKFSKDRTVPITENAASYLSDLIGSRHADSPLFWGSGLPTLSRAAITRRFKELVRRSGLDREGLSVHALRHACATHLLAHGADIRYVQELLGHSSVQTTVRYTQENIENIRRRYIRAHPRENEFRPVLDDAYRANLAQLQERLTKAAYKRDQRHQRLDERRGSSYSFPTSTLSNRVRGSEL